MTSKTSMSRNMIFKTGADVKSLRYFFAVPAYKSVLLAASSKCVVTTSKFVWMALRAFP